MKVFRVNVNRPRQPKQDPWETQRSVYVVSDSMDESVRKAIEYFNDLDDADDYFTTGVDILASTDGEGEVLLR